MSFNNVSQVIVAGPAVNNVARDQVNVAAGVVNISSRADDEPTEYDEFERVKIGNIHLLKEIHRRGTLYCRCWRENCGCGARHRVLETIYSVELVGRQSKCTAISYEGQEAQEFWEEDFRWFSQNRSPDTWQLYALNRSNVPFLIFHDELVPVGHFYKDSFWGDLFISCLMDKLGCNVLEIWLNTKGILIKGPQGPDFYVDFIDEDLIPDGIPIPSSVEMLKDDVSFQFFQKFPSATWDDLIVTYALWQYASFDDLGYLFRERPHNILLENTPGCLRVDTVYSPSLGAVARCRDGGALWKTGNVLQGLVDKTVMDDGLIRFKLDGPEVYADFRLNDLEFDKSWLTQRSRIIDAYRMSETEEQCSIVCFPASLILSSSVFPQLKLFGFVKHPPIFGNPLAIYLFVYPPPMTVSGIKSWRGSRNHFWSLDENGRSEMTEVECCRWRVPMLFTHVECHGPYLYTWPSHVYAAIRNWQVARGFDPTTTDFARSLRFPEFDILIDNATAGSRFEAVHENSSSGSSTPETWSGQSTLKQFYTPLPAEVAIPQPSRITVPPNHSLVKARLRTEPQMQPLIHSSDPVSILGKRQRGNQIQTRSTRQRV